MEMIVLTLTASGSVSDFSDNDVSSLQQNIANAAGVDKLLVTIRVAAASVRITATIAVPVTAIQTAAVVQGALSSTLGTVDDAYKALGMREMGLAVKTVPTFKIISGNEARTALVTATQSNPGYSLAYENLGDLYLRLAAESYKRAQSLGRTSGATAQRLADLQKIVSPAKAAPGARAVTPATRNYTDRAAANVGTTTLPMSPTFQFNGPSGALAAPYVAPSQ
jgi:hypothetical protein